MSRVGAIVLAAGLSSRMGGANKLLADLNGLPVIERTLCAVVASGASEVCVVTGHEAVQLESLIQKMPVNTAFNEDFSQGMASSIVTGVKSLGDDLDGVLICLGDMPAISSALIDGLIAAFEHQTAKSICLPVFESQRGHPVLLGRDYLSSLLELRGDQGAKCIIAANEVNVLEIQSNNEGVLLDTDTPTGLARLREFLLS